VPLATAISVSVPFATALSVSVPLATAISVSVPFATAIHVSVPFATAISVSVLLAATISDANKDCSGSTASHGHHGLRKYLLSYRHPKHFVMVGRHCNIIVAGTIMVISKCVSSIGFRTQLTVVIPPIFHTS
jgi:hypothetical protein